VTVVEKKKKRSGYRKVDGPEFVLDADVVPLPERKRIGAVRIYFPLDVLEVGRSFTTRRTMGTVRKAVRRFKLDSGTDVQFMVEEQPDGRVRCWRTA
jgi:hypothetical protein